MKTLFNQPHKTVFCRSCVLSNQKPVTIPEFLHQKDRKNASYMQVTDDQVCVACKFHKLKYSTINWKKREKELLKLLDKYRSKNYYDCLVPGSGGKDSAFTAHILKHKYGMNPLTVTWPPIMYTDYGKKNFDNWLKYGGFDNVLLTPNPSVRQKLTQLSFKNLLHPFQPFVLGQKNLAPQIAQNFGIKLIFFGENESEYGAPMEKNKSPKRSREFFTIKKIDDTFISGVKYKDLRNKYKFSYHDLMPYMPIQEKSFNKDIETHYLGYYLKWIPQENYYYVVENCGFAPRPYRTDGTFLKFQSIDDKIDDIHYYAHFIKFGLGRASHDAAKEIRNKHITIQEAKNLVKKYDGEFPKTYIKENLEFLELSLEKFNQIIDKFRSPHIWKKIGKKWKLRHTVNLDGYND